MVRILVSPRFSPAKVKKTLLKRPALETSMSVGMTLTLRSAIAGCTFLPLTKHIISARQGFHSFLDFVLCVADRDNLRKCDVLLPRTSSGDRPCISNPEEMVLMQNLLGVKYLVYCLERVSLKHWCGSFSEMLWKLSAASRS